MIRFMRPTVIAALTCVLFLKLCSAAAPLNVLTEAERRGGWKLLFDGKTTGGWRNYQRANISDGWVVQDAALSRQKNGAGDIITTQKYKYFELSIDYRICPGGNSGVMFHVTEDAQRPAWSGPEIQVQDNADGHDPQKAGWLYQLYKPVTPDWVREAEQHVGFSAPEAEIVDATRPAGQWNQIYLRVAPQQCEVVLNGVHYYYFVKGDEDWKQRVAASKFAKWPQFGRANEGHLCLQDHGSLVSFRNIKIRELGDDGAVPDPIDGELPLKGVLAFPHLEWANWEGIDERGRLKEFRPMELTHAGDGSGRIFVATQDGMVHTVKNDSTVRRSKLFLDLRAKVADFADANEEGLLGLAFDPQYLQSRELFVYYSSRSEPQTSIVSRFRASKDDPDIADLASEEIILRIPQPFYNHNGGSIAFGPDGYLYVGLGDGGSRNDPLGNGQNLATWMGSILRIDVKSRQGDRNYAIPPDNPFLAREAAQPEIFAYGFRNVWRLSFDRLYGTLWAADVGQDLWEEVNIVRKGGNYGWGSREGTHPFGNAPFNASDQSIDPIWEYDHQVGKSITGGFVYRGARLPELHGKYLYADYVTGKIWALQYDQSTGKVIRNMRISSGGIPVLAFGEDEAGEVYYMVGSISGRTIYRFERTN